MSVEWGEAGEPAADVDEAGQAWDERSPRFDERWDDERWDDERGPVYDDGVPCGEPGAEVLDLATGADEVARWAALAPLGEGILTPFGVLDPALLSQDGCIDLVVGIERVKCWLDAQQARVLAHAIAHPAPVLTGAQPRRPLSALERFAQGQWAEESLVAELACALRWSRGVTRQRVHTASVLVDRLPATLGTVEAGTLSYLHARSLVEAVKDLDEQTTGRLEARVLPRAGTQSLGEFRAAIRRGLAVLDPRGQQEKHDAAARERRVCYEPDAHAMAWLNAYLPALDAQQVMIAIQAVADTMKAADPPGTRTADHRSADQLRADALSAICAAALTGQSVQALLGTGLPHWQGRRPTINVTVALSTLAGLDDQPGDLDGYGPIPASLTRRIAADPTGTWHRLVTDELGRLLDYGRATYRPPQDLTDFITTRDRTCRGIACTRTSQRCHLDHIHDWADGGTTSPTNLAPQCPRDHNLKHIAGWTTHTQPDGTTRWTSPTGRNYDKPPDRHPIDHTRPKLTYNNNDDPPPF